MGKRSTVRAMTRSYLFLRCILAGVVAGLAGGCISWLFDFVMDLIGFSVVPFGFPGHMVVLALINVLGIIPMWLIGRFVSQPVPAYFTLVIVVAVAFSVLVAVYPPYSGGFTLFAAIPGVLLTAVMSAIVATQIAYRGGSSEPVVA